MKQRNEHYLGGVFYTYFCDLCGEISHVSNGRREKPKPYLRFGLGDNGKTYHLCEECYSILNTRIEKVRDSFNDVCGPSKFKRFKDIEGYRKR